MGINVKITLMVMLISITMTSNTCHKSILGCAESSYSFILPARAYPDKDTININDTTWVEINSPDLFIDQRSNQSITFSGAVNLGTDMGFIKIINSSPIQITNAANDFDYVLVTGREITSPNTQLIKEFLFADVNNNYLFKLGIIAKHTGLYSFNLGNAVHVYRKNNACPKADFQIILTQTNQHYYLYPGGIGVTPGGADYYFYVQ